MGKKLIWEKKTEFESFERSVIDTAEKCNSLIATFHAFQDWQKIDTIEDWLYLVTDPQLYFDSVLIGSVKIDTGGRQADPLVLASLVSVDRPNYLNMVAGIPVFEDECIPCRKLKQKKGSRAISISSYQSYQKYLIFNAGHFTVNEEAVELAKENFKIYADSPEKLEVVTFWENLCGVLNNYHTRYHIQNEDKRSICKALKLQQSEGYEGDFVVNPQALSLEIQSTF
jgi:hypothetical protein